MFTSAKKILLPLFVLFALIPSHAQTPPVITTTLILDSGLTLPLQLVFPPDGSKRRFVIQQMGDVLVFDSAFHFQAKFLTVPVGLAGGEEGLLSLVFHPDYVNNGYFFVYFTNSSGNLELARYKVSTHPDSADYSSKVTVLTIPHPIATNHNGGEMHFGKDGFLYLSTGDGGSTPSNAQDTALLLGKLLRINVNTSASAPFYTLPPGNPFGNEIFDLGLRNPFRWSFDRLTGDIWIGDVGTNKWEEIDFRPANLPPGSNFGWPCFEGNAPYQTSGCDDSASFVFPVHVYATPKPLGSVVGGVTYRGTVFPALYGWNISADVYRSVYFCTTASTTGGWITSKQSPGLPAVADFSEDENGEIYVVSMTGKIYRLGTSSVAGVEQQHGIHTHQPSVIATNEWLHLSFEPGIFHKIEIVGLDGEIKFRRAIGSEDRATDIHLPGISGIHVLRFSGANYYYSVKAFLR